MKNSHCVNRKATIVTALFLLAATLAGAQSPRNLWLDSDNPAGIRQDTAVAKSALAELYSGMEAGGFRQTWEGSLPWTAGARVYSLVHLRRMSMEGSFHFEQMGGSDMCGSMLLDPQWWPLDVLEFTPGRKSRQLYAFTGAFSTDLTGQWRIGGALNFSSANYTKRKDLRYSNYCLDLSVAPGAVWHRGDLSLGLNLIFGKKSETPVAKQIGTKDSFYAFLDKGLMYGSYELWDGSGVHLAEAGVNGFPLRELSAGAGVQLQKGRFYAALDYRYAYGRAGEKQQIWFRFPSHNSNLDLGWDMLRAGALHSFRATASFRQLVNSETVLERYTEGGLSKYRELSSRPILGRQQGTLRLDYGLEDGRNSITAALGFSGGADYMSQLYPYILERRSASWEAEAAYMRKLGQFGIGASLLYADGAVRDSGRDVNADSGVASEAFRLSDWDARAVEYTSAARIAVGLQGKYSFWKGLFVRLDLSYMRAFGISLLPGADRFKGEISFGYEF